MERSIIGTLILLLTAMATYSGFKHSHYFDRNKFMIDGILKNKQYDRLLSSGFLHANWIHFGFNMIALMAFSISLEHLLGVWTFLFLYLASLLGGSLLALYIHRNHGDYSAVGASGAVAGVIFATIILYPTSSISFVLLPLEIKNWVFGIAYVLISIYGIKSQLGNIGHEAHLGGALTGTVLTMAIRPSVITENWWMILLVVVPISTFLVLLIRNPAMLLVDHYWGQEVARIRSRKPVKKTEKSLDEILDKIAQKGVESLSKKEQQLLDKYRDKL